MNIKILGISFLAGFLFLGLTNSIQSLGNIPNQGAALIMNDQAVNTDKGIEDTLNENEKRIQEGELPLGVKNTSTPPRTTSGNSGGVDLGGIVSCDGVGGEKDCDITTFGSTIRNVISTIIEIGLVVAALVFAYAGWLFMSARGDTGKITQAKGIFWKVLVGVILAMSAFLIVEIILSSLGVKEGVGQWVNRFIG